MGLRNFPAREHGSMMAFADVREFWPHGHDSGSKSLRVSGRRALGVFDLRKVSATIHGAVFQESAAGFAARSYAGPIALIVEGRRSYWA